MNKEDPPFLKKNKVCDFLFAFMDNAAIRKMASTLKGKHLFREEQILSFKSWQLLRKDNNEIECVPISLIKALKALEAWAS